MVERRIHKFTSWSHLLSRMPSIEDVRLWQKWLIDGRTYQPKVRLMVLNGDVADFYSEQAASCERPIPVIQESLQTPYGEIE